MFRRELIIVAIAAFFSFCCAAEAEQISVSWDGGGNYNDWDEANNWDPNVVPNNGIDTYTVTIDAGTGEVNVGLRQRVTIDQLDCYGEVGLFIGPHDWQNEPVKLTLANPNGLTNYGDLDMSGYLSQLYVWGNVTNTAGAALILEAVEIKGDLYNNQGGTIEVELENDVEGDLHNEGTITIIPGSDLLCEGEFHNLGLVELYDAECSGDGLFDNSNGGTISGCGMIWSEELIQNKGTIRASSGSLLLYSEGSVTNSGTLANNPSSSLHIKPGEDVNNQGMIEVNAGGGIAFDCNLVNDPNGAIKLLGGNLAAGTITQKAGAEFEGFGGITAEVVIEDNGIIKLTGPTNIVGGVEIGIDATLEISDGTTLVTGHTTNNGTIHMKGGRIIPQGGFTNNGSVIWEPGVYNNIADFNLDGEVNLQDFADFGGTWLWQAQL